MGFSVRRSVPSSVASRLELQCCVRCEKMPLTSQIGTNKRMLDWLRKILSTNRIVPPSANLLSISKSLALPRQPSLQDLVSGRSESAEQALLNYCEANDEVNLVMKKFGASREDLARIYTALVGVGAGQWVGEHYVAASAIAHSHALHYLLETPIESKDQTIEKAYKLLEHFEHGIPLA